HTYTRAGGMQVTRLAVLVVCLAGLTIGAPAKLGDIARSSQRPRGRTGGRSGGAGRLRGRSFNNRPANRGRSTLGGQQQEGYNYDEPPQQPANLYETPSNPPSPPPPGPPPPPATPPNALYETPASNPPSPPAARPPPPPPPARPPPPPARPPTQLYEEPSNNVPVQTPPDNYGPGPGPSPPQRPSDPAGPAPGGMMAGMPYDFEYGVSDPDSGNEYSRQENSDGNTVSGEYRVLLPDGRTQIVRYFDDGNGFNAEVTYE
ncbi:unnamed protein product, partial [Meganyctiphanes norvegica]